MTVLTVRHITTYQYKQPVFFGKPDDVASAQES